MKSKGLLLSLACLSLAIVSMVTDARNQTVVGVDRYAPVNVTDPGVSAFLASAQNPHFLDHVTFTPESATYYDLVSQQFPLNQPEMQHLSQNGFVVTDRLAFSNFSVGYGYIYWKDLPVLVTTDSILHAVHQSYEDLLKQTENNVLLPTLTDFLTRTRQQLQTDAEDSSDPDMKALFADLDTYLSVTLNLLTGATGDSPASTAYVQLAVSANSEANVNLFGLRRPIDFSLFQPRGIYTDFVEREQYFRAMIWLSQVDFRLVSYDLQGNPTLNGGQIAAAILLRNAINEANVRSTWDSIDTLLTNLVGRSDNVTLTGLDHFLADAETSSPGDFVQANNADSWLGLLTGNDYGRQIINGQLLGTAPDNPNPQPHPVSFKLLGQRYTIDSDVMGSLVYDQLLVNGQKVERPLPSPLDVMYALGNDRAATDLQSELERYHYQDSLEEARVAVSSADSAFWSANGYNRSLSLLRALNNDTTDSAYPQAMRTAGWADKTLQTELASWTQLRHDNILYTTELFLVSTLCQYPAGYVEPYPDFYAAVGDYARSGEALFGSLPAALFSSQTSQAFQQSAVAYFQTLAGVADQLRSMAEKELAQQPFSATDDTFIKTIAVHDVQKTYCSNCYQAHWTGWYPSLFPWQYGYGTQYNNSAGSLDSPALVADLATNPNVDPGSALYPPGVLYGGTGPASLMVFIVDSAEGQMMYVGPAFSYYEDIEQGFPPARLSDNDWNDRLNNFSSRPTPPSWTASFRTAYNQPPTFLMLPTEPGS